MVCEKQLKSDCTIGWICKLSRNWSSICKWSRLQISLLCRLDDLLSIFTFILGARAFTGTTKTDDPEKQQQKRCLIEWRSTFVRHISDNYCLSTRETWASDWGLFWVKFGDLVVISFRWPTLGVCKCVYNLKGFMTQTDGRHNYPHADNSGFTGDETTVGDCRDRQWCFNHCNYITAICRGNYQ